MTPADQLADAIVFDILNQHDSHVYLWERARMIRQAGLEAVRKELEK